MRDLWVYVWFLILGSPWVAWLYRWLRTRYRERQGQLIRQSRGAGLHLVEQHKWPQAVATLDRALALATRHTPTQEADLHFYRGYALEQMKQVEQEHKSSLDNSMDIDKVEAGLKIINRLSELAEKYGFIYNKVS